MSRKVVDRANVHALRELSRLFDELNPDVIHAHASVAGALARVAARRRIPIVWTPHAVQDRTWVLLVERSLRRLTHVVVALSPPEGRVIVAKRLATERQVRIIPNGISTAKPFAAEPSRSALGIPQDAPVVGFIGRKCDQKAPLVFVDAARLVLAALPGAHVVLVGSGAMLDEALEVASKLPEGRFHHVACDAGAEHLLGSFDVLVSPSTYEGGPYLSLEAMHAGIPVVASDCSGLRDYVVHGVSGLTVKVGDVEGFAKSASESSQMSPCAPR